MLSQSDCIVADFEKKSRPRHEQIKTIEQELAGLNTLINAHALLSNNHYATARHQNTRNEREARLARLKAEETRDLNQLNRLTNEVKLLIEERTRIANDENDIPRRKSERENRSRLGFQSVSNLTDENQTLLRESLESDKKAVFNRCKKMQDDVEQNAHPFFLKTLDKSLRDNESNFSSDDVRCLQAAIKTQLAHDRIAQLNQQLQGMTSAVQAEQKNLAKLKQDMFNCMLKFNALSAANNNAGKKKNKRHNQLAFAALSLAGFAVAIFLPVLAIVVLPASIFLLLAVSVKWIMEAAENHFQTESNLAAINQEQRVMRRMRSLIDKATENISQLNNDINALKEEIAQISSTNVQILAVTSAQYSERFFSASAQDSPTASPIHRATM